MKKYSFLGIEVMISKEKTAENEIAKNLEDTCKEWDTMGNYCRIYIRYLCLFGNIMAYANCLKIMGAITKKQLNNLANIADERDKLYRPQDESD